MSSVLSNSTIGLDDSDSRGSIEQPIMDQKVISIGGSSSEVLTKVPSIASPSLQRG